MFDVIPRSSTWAAIAANWDQFFHFKCHEGTGDTLTDVLGTTVTEAFSGTTTNLWDQVSYGVLGATDGAFALPVACNQAFNWSESCVFGLSAWVAVNTTGINGNETVLAAGIDNTTEANEPGGGHFRLQLFGTGANLYPRTLYRNASTDAAPPGNQTNGWSGSDIGSATYARACLQTLISSDGSTVTWTQYHNGTSIESNTFTVDGTGPLNLAQGRESAVTLCRIGGSFQNLDPLTVRATWNLNSATSGGCVEAVTFFRSTTRTSAEALAVLTSLYKERNEAPV